MKFPDGILDGIMDPKYIPAELGLNNLIETDDDRKTRNAKISVQSRFVDNNTPNVAASTAPGVPIPLTREEAEQVDLRIEVLRNRSAALQIQIASMQSQIDLYAEATDTTQEVSFSMDISKKASLRRAIQKVFGVKTDVITYSMYMAALRAKNKLEIEDSEDYIAGED